MKHARIDSTAADIREAGRRARATAKNLTIIVDARYARSQDALVVRLNTGSTFTVPRARLPGFEALGPAALRRLAIEPPGTFLWVDDADVGVRLETLVIVAAGETTLRTAAAQLLGSRRSAQKAASSAANGRLGGRPPKRKTARTAA